MQESCCRKKRTPFTQLYCCAAKPTKLYPSAQPIRHDEPDRRYLNTTVCVRACVCAWVRVCVCVRSSIPVCVHARVRVCAGARTRLRGIRAVANFAAIDGSRRGVCWKREPARRICRRGGRRCRRHICVCTGVCVRARACAGAHVRSYVRAYVRAGGRANARASGWAGRQVGLQAVMRHGRACWDGGWRCGGAA